IMGFQLTQTGEGAGNYDRQIWVGTDGKLYLAAYDDNLLQPDFTVSPGIYTDDTWHYVVGIRNDTDDTLRLYVDGSEVASVANGKAESYTGYFRIGSYTNTGWANGISGYFPGTVDEIRLSDTVRSADWVSTEYNNQSDASGSIIVGAETGNPYPFIESWTLAEDFSYVDVTFSQGVYSTSLGSGALDTSDFSLIFSQNGGNATNATILSVTKLDSNPLAGGETVIRVNLIVTGSPSGVETIEIKPADGSSVYDGIGAAASADTTTGLIGLTSPSWYNGAWVYRIKITIDNTKVTGDLLDYPYVIHIASNAGLRDNARADGYDLLFTGDDEVTKLDHEVEKYVTGTGELV
ncbi:hypothetical protein LCGC14_3079490, partial [marine sediment metagenome]